MKIRRGTLNPETGLVFGGYGKSYLNGEWWTTPEKLEQRKKKERDYLRKKYQESEDARKQVLEKNRKWRNGKGKSWVKNYESSKEVRGKKLSKYKEKYSSCEVFRKTQLDRNKKFRETAKYKDWEKRRNSKPERRNWIRARFVQRKNEDFGFLLKTRIRSKISKIIRANGIRTSQTLEKYSGANPDKIKSFIESQFVNGMSWENRSRWHIDHFFPISLAKNEQELKIFSFFTNLRPMWASDNCRKGAIPPTPSEMIERLDFIDSWFKSQTSNEHRDKSQVVAA